MPSPVTQSTSSSNSPSLPALAKAGSEQAQNYFNYHRLAHLIALLLSLFMLLLKHYDLLIYSLAVIAVLAEVFAWWFRYKEEHYHHLSRELMRRAILADGFGKTGNTQEIVHLRQSFDDPLFIQRAAQFDQLYQDGGGYFTSDFSPGSARFLDNLQESACWSSYLYRIIARRTFWIIGLVLLTVMIIVFAIIPVVAAGNISIIPKLFSVLFIFWLADELTTGLAWWEAADSATQVDRRVGDLLKSQNAPLEELLAVFGDYAVATAAAPPIATRFYKQHRKQLNELWEQRKAGRKIIQSHS